MRLTQEQRGRLAMSTLIGVIAFVALNQACGVIPDIVIWWLIYVLGSGVVLNTTKGEPPRVLVRLAILPALAPVLVAGFFILAQQPMCISVPSPLAVVILPVASWAGIYVFSGARKPIITFVKFALRPKTKERVERITTIIQLIISSIAAIVLALTTLGKR